VTHTVREKQKLLARIRRVRGQVEAVERAVESEAECEKVMHLIAGIRGSMASLMAEVMEDHVRAHIVGSHIDPDSRQAAEHLIEIVHAYLK
jgi:DNA-binding FrmR family transcriptional regulator